MTQIRDPLLETKLHVPRGGRGLVVRQRLRERLSAGVGSVLTLISAPAGFGKTTLLTEWLAAVPGDGPAAERRPGRVPDQSDLELTEPKSPSRSSFESLSSTYQDCQPPPGLRIVNAHAFQAASFMRSIAKLMRLFQARWKFLSSLGMYDGPRSESRWESADPAAGSARPAYRTLTSSPSSTALRSTNSTNSSSIASSKVGCW